MLRHEITYVAIAHIIALVAIIGLAGCSSGAIDPTGIRKPDAVLMLPPAPPEKLKVGDDLKLRYASLRRSYGRETARLRDLQRYVRTITGP